MEQIAALRSLGFGLEEWERDALSEGFTKWTRLAESHSAAESLKLQGYLVVRL